MYANVTSTVKGLLIKIGHLPSRECFRFHWNASACFVNGREVRVDYLINRLRRLFEMQGKLYRPLSNLSEMSKFWINARRQEEIDHDRWLNNLSIAKVWKINDRDYRILKESSNGEYLVRKLMISDNFKWILNLSLEDSYVAIRSLTENLTFHSISASTSKDELGIKGIAMGVYSKYEGFYAGKVKENLVFIRTWAKNL